MKACTNKKIIIVIICFIAVVLYAVAVYRVNKNTPVVEYKTIEKGDEVTYKNYTIKVIDSKVYDLSELKKIYGIEDYEYKAPLEDEHVKCILTHMVITKNYEWTNDMDYEYSAINGEVSTSTWSNGIEGDLFYLINSDYTASEDKVGESYDVMVPVLALDIHYPEKMWNDLLGVPTYIVYEYNKEFGGVPRLMIN